MNYYWQPDWTNPGDTDLFKPISNGLNGVRVGYVRQQAPDEFDVICYGKLSPDSESLATFTTLEEAKAYLLLEVRMP